MLLQAASAPLYSVRIDRQALKAGNSALSAALEANSNVAEQVGVLDLIGSFSKASLNCSQLLYWRAPCRYHSTEFCRE